MRSCFLIAVFCLASFATFSQTNVTADVGLFDAHFESPTGGEINANLIATNQIFKVKVVVANFEPGVAAPAGHVRLKIGLGVGLQLSPGFNLATAPLSSYFSWSYDLSGSQPQIIGNSVAALPANFADYAIFDVKAMNSTDNSYVTFNLLTLNPNGSSYTLSDPNSLNNAASNNYKITIAAPLPVTFSRLGAIKSGCDINVLWNAENQLSLKKYEIEASKDNVSFVKVGEVSAKNSSDYTLAFPLTSQIKANTVFVRIKSIDLDGSSRYSNVTSVNGNCDGKWQLSLFPNPVADLSSVNVVVRQGLFDGKYKITIISGGGQIVQQSQLSLSATKTFPLAVKGLSSGKYHLQITNVDGSETATLDFEKL